MAQTQPLPRSTPESQGIDSAGLLTLVDTLDQKIEHLHSLMIARHGKVVAEGWWAPYRAEKPHMLFSLSKSFTSSAIGLAVQEGILSLNDRVIDFFPDDLPADVSDNLAAMELRHLLMMGTGNHVDATPALREDPDGNWVRAFLAQPVEHEPGTYFVYNSAATYMCSAILQKRTGSTVLDYLRPRLLDPLGIGEATWESCPRGINVGGWGLKITTEDILRFGVLYAQRGVWKGQRILTEEWIDQATSKQISNSGNTEPDWRQGYGFQFWRCRHNAYRGDGAFGQYCIVLPEHDTVIAITSGVANMQAVLDVIWEYLLPALHAEPLSEDPAAHTRLVERQAALALPTPVGQAT
ncbi:MAG TPA: serine hydrolase domain-containing protein, partial [Roseiflexaceae bacterium]|nr:serine hydrolase domain-containing protein [Roseiflexaceae bacterium]